MKETSIGVEKQDSLIRLLAQALLVYTLGEKDLVNVVDRRQCEDLNKNTQVGLFFI